MKISVISISVIITGTGYADIVHMHYLRNATLQLEVSENRDAIVFLSEFTEALNSSPHVENRPNTSFIFCVLGIVWAPVRSLISSHSDSQRWFLTPCYKQGLRDTEGFLCKVWGSNPSVTDPKADWSCDLFALISFFPIENLFLINNLRQKAFTPL